MINPEFTRILVTEHVAQLRLKNVSFRQGDITELSQFEDRSVDGVISTMVLHHLPTRDHLDACFREIARILVVSGFAPVRVAELGQRPLDALTLAGQKLAGTVGVHDATVSNQARPAAGPAPRRR